MILVLPARENERMVAHLCRAYPEEGCGVLLGRDHGQKREVVGIIALENRLAESRHNRYLIPPEQFLAADRMARAAGLDVIGFFHSHPDHPARPSTFDLQHAWPYYSYVIVNITRGEAGQLRSWRLAEDRSAFEEEVVEAGNARSASAPAEEHPGSAGERG